MSKEIFLIICLLSTAVYWLFSVLIHESGHYFISKYWARKLNYNFYPPVIFIGDKKSKPLFPNENGCIKVMSKKFILKGYFDTPFFTLLADSDIELKKKKQIIRWCVSGGVLSMTLIAAIPISILFVVLNCCVDTSEYYIIFDFISNFLILFGFVSRIIISIVGNNSKSCDRAYFINPDLFIEKHKTKIDK